MNALIRTMSMMEDNDSYPTHCQIGAEVLRKEARQVRDFDAGLHDLLDDMFGTMLDGQGIGLGSAQRCGCTGRNLSSVFQKWVVLHICDSNGRTSLSSTGECQGCYRCRRAGSVASIT